MSSRVKYIVAIHGAGMNGGVWGSLAAGLSLPCQALSLPGHGKTAGALLPSIEKMADWVKTKLADHAAHSIVLAGHSMGALVALEAARHPSVAGLVLLGAAAKMPVHPELLHQASADPDTAADMILKWGISPVHPQAIAVRTMLKGQMQFDTLASDLKACNVYQGGEAAAKGISCPALILSGLDDKLTKPADSQLLAEMLEQGEFHVMPEGGHMLMAEKPVETAKEINGFIETLAG